MYRSLEDLRDSVDRLIADHGKNAPCAAWVFTSDDVYDIDDGGEIVLRSVEVADKVLEAVGDIDYIYELIGNRISEELREI